MHELELQVTQNPGFEYVRFPGTGVPGNWLSFRKFVSSKPRWGRRVL